MQIVEALGLPLPSVVAVVGCGGKTSLIKRLAECSQSNKVLISPTTKMFPVSVGNADCLGVLDRKTGKLESLPADELANLVPLYDIVLLEADGSRSLPCKGWMEYEPVIPEYCTHTIGVVTLNALGKPATGDIVHNLPQFLALTGLREGEEITLDSLIEMVCAPGGMFKNSIGSRILLVNQVEDQATADIANAFLRSISERYPDFFTKLLLGSVHDNIWQEV